MQYLYERLFQLCKQLVYRIKKCLLTMLHQFYSPNKILIPKYVQKNDKNKTILYNL